MSVFAAAVKFAVSRRHSPRSARSTAYRASTCQPFCMLTISTNDLFSPLSAFRRASLDHSFDPPGRHLFKVKSSSSELQYPEVFISSPETLVSLRPGSYDPQGQFKKLLQNRACQLHSCRQENLKFPRSNCSPRGLLLGVVAFRYHFVDAKFVRSICVAQDRKSNLNLFAFIDSHNKDLLEWLNLKVQRIRMLSLSKQMSNLNVE